MRAPDLPCPAPNRSPRPPRTRLPSGACDTHAHICGPAAAFPYADERIYTPPDSTLEDYLRLLEALGVDRAVLVQPSVYGTDNRALLDALKRGGQGLCGVAVVKPDISAGEIRALNDAGVRGVRFNLVDHAGERNVVPVDVIRTLAKAIAPLGWHIEFLVNLDEAPRFAQAVAELPVDVVVGHLGYPRNGAGAWSNAASLDAFLRLFETGRCWVKLTGPYRISAAPDLPYADVVPLARRLAGVNPDRLLWGTDWPHVMNKKPMPNDGDLTDLIADWLPDAALRERVLVTNPAALYRFSGGETLGANAR
jgi:2-pyrone-4,6-dicarboxylate lactonase